MSSGATSVEVHTFDAILSDFDGTIFDSTDAITQYWYKMSTELGVEPEQILKTSHGRRSIDTIALYDKSKANWDHIHTIESRIPDDFGSKAANLPGSHDLLLALSQNGAQWGIVTSGTHALITRWMEMFDLPRPSVFVGAEDVEAGKPNPQGYLLGRQRLGLAAGSTSILVLEDAPAGIQAGKAAGFRVLAVTTTHPVDVLRRGGGLGG